MKETKSRKWIVFSSIIFGLIVLAISYFSGFFFDIGISPCIIPPPPHIMVDGIALAKIYTWNDENENGIVDNNEPVLPNVEIAYPVSSPKQFTDNFGKAETGQFKPGCSCKCWKHEYVEVTTPNGYRVTTPVRIEMTGNNLLYAFGFVKIYP